METRLSRYGQASTSPSPVNRMMAAFARSFRDGVDINLGVGYVNESTIPVGRLNEAMQAVASDGLKYRQAFNYGTDRKALLKAIAGDIGELLPGPRKARRT